MDEPFPNPESNWHSERGAVEVDRSEIARRLGPVKEAIVYLSGGLANDTFRIGPDRVLRIYRRDVRALRREHILLSRRWQHLRVPRVLKAGDDFLVLEYVQHRPLLSTAAHGVAVGAALAEIHSIRFDRCGLFDDTIEVKEAFRDFPTAMEDYIQSCITSAPDHAVVLERAVEWIADHQDVLRRECASPVLLHGDFKASNLRWAIDSQLLVLDWEFAYAGPPLMDVGQLSRWGIPQPFCHGFQEGYVEYGGRLAENWERQARFFDLVNLVGLLAKSMHGSRQAKDCLHRIEQTLAAAEMP